MRKITAPILLAFAFLAGVHSAAAADLKVGIVDMRRVFDSYYKTVEANMAITNEAADMQKSIDSMVADAEKTQDAILKAREKANDQSISADERAKSQKIVDAKTAEFQSMQADIQNFNQRETTRLRNKKSQRMETLIDEITNKLDQLAKKDGFTFVLDKSGEAVPGVPIVLYTNGENDITDELIKTLNAAAPADFKPPPPAGKN